MRCVDLIAEEWKKDAMACDLPIVSTVGDHLMRSSEAGCHLGQRKAMTWITADNGPGKSLQILQA